MSVSIEKIPVATLDSGRELVSWTLTSSSGLKATILNYGGILHQLWVPDAKGNVVDVILGMEDPRSYVVSNGPYFSALIGRFANRIANACFELDGKRFQLSANAEPHQLHGGFGGLHQKWWSVQPDDRGVVLTTELAEGDDGFPGNMQVEVRIELTEQNGLRYDYQARTDRATVVNLTCHPYFNLSGEASGRNHAHRFQIAADRFLPTDAKGIPYGIQQDVEGTPFDFREMAELGPRLKELDPQLTQVGGIDHCLIFSEDVTLGNPAATVEDPQSGRRMQVFTSEPAVQFYTGNFLEPEPAMKTPYSLHSGFCLETQHLPDSPNHPEFPSVRLDPGDLFESTTEYRFSW